MKNLKNFLPLAAFILGLGLVLTQSAFKSPRTPVYYQFEDNDDENIFDGTHWRDLAMEGPEECSVGETLPCIVNIEGYADIQTFLDQFEETSDLVESEAVESKKLLVTP